LYIPDTFATSLPSTKAPY